MLRRASLLWELYSRVRVLLGLYMLLVALGAAIEGLALASIVPLIEGSSTDGVSGFYRDLIKAVGLDASSDISVVIVVAVLFVLRSAVQYASALVAGTMVRRQAVGLQVEMFGLFLGLDWEKSLAITQGEINMLLGGQVQQVALFLRSCVALAEGIVYTVALTTVAILVSPTSTLVAVALIGSSAVGVALIARRVRRYSEEILATSKRQAGILLQFARAVQVLRSYGVADQAVAEIESLARTREHTQFRSQRVNAIGNVLPDLVFVLALLTVVGLAVRAGEGLAAVGAVVALLFRVSQYLKRFSIVASLSAMLPAVTDVIRFRRHFQRNQAPDVESIADPALLPGQLQIDNVRFTYAGAPSPALRGVTLRLEPGEFVGIVGSSGSGKSTLIQIAVGLLTPRSGSVRAGIRRSDEGGWGVAYVPQTPFVLKGTIASNVAWFRQISEETIQTACEAAGLSALLSRLPDGIHTEIGQEGLTLSGGERQRLAMARALAGSPQILVLDEATSALDSESEKAIERSLERMHGHVTVVAVAHRLSTVLGADRIVVLEGGRVVEEAPPDELLGRDGRFAHLSALQGIQRSD